MLTPDPPANSSATATTSGARDHARAQAGTIVEAMPVVPARMAPHVPEGIAPTDLVWLETVPGGGYATKSLARGTRLRLTDIAGDACAHLALFHASQPYERLNVADTVKVLWNAYLTTGHLLLSDQGRVLASITHDSSRHHDTMSGPSTRARNEARYGSGHASGPSPAGREQLIVAGAKHGLEPRDIPASISFFQGVTVDDDGSLRFHGSAGAGAEIELLAELPLIVLIANSPHPIDPREHYTCSALRIAAWRSSATTPTDVLWSASPEGERAFLNTADFLEAAGQS